MSAEFSPERLQSELQTGDIPQHLASTQLEPTDVAPPPSSAVPERIEMHGLTLVRQRKLGETESADVWLYASDDEPPLFATVKHSKIDKTDLLHNQVLVMQRIEERCGGIRGQISALSLADLEADERTLEEQHKLVVLPYVDGMPLVSIMEKTGPLPVQQTLHIAAKIAERLSAIHNAGIAHRDVKPENTIVLTPRIFHPRPADDVEFIDFSLSDVRGTREEFQQGGTPLYLAPELWSHGNWDLKLEQSGDVYALGHIMYEMNMGRPLLLENVTCTEMYHRQWDCVKGKFDDKLQQLAPCLRPIVKLALMPHQHRPHVKALLTEIHGACERLAVDPQAHLLTTASDIPPPDPVPLDQIARSFRQYLAEESDVDPMHFRPTVYQLDLAQKN